MELKKKLIVMAVALFVSMAMVAGATARGDVNGDGVVNGADVTALYNVLLENVNPAGDADVNGDGVVNGSDVTALYNLLLNPVDNDDDLFAECYATLRSKRVIDEYYSANFSFVRCLWMLNELTTDEAHCAWADEGIADLNHNTWDANNPWIKGMFMRLCDNIDVCNSYLARSGHDAQHNAEVRVLRAYYYFELMDLYGKAPFSTTTAPTIEGMPKSRTELFDFVESELLACRSSLASARNADYGRIDVAAAKLLLARLYLNAEVYTGTARWQDACDMAQEVIQSGYKLLTASSGDYNAFQLMFMGDNDTNGARQEIIFPIAINGAQAQTEYDYNSTTFLVASTTDYKIAAVGTGFNEAWAGNRARKQFSQLFFGTDENIDDGHFNEWPTMLGDRRALIETADHTLSIDDESSFYKGFAYVKWLGAHSTGAAPSNNNFVDTDYPLLRLAEAFLTYAEADARLNDGRCTTSGLQAFNLIRMRAGVSAMRSANLNDIFAEWGREFGFEGRRRIDLVRFGSYGGSHDYDWEWKNASREGSAFDVTRNIFPIPNAVLALNTNLTQNSGYDAHPADIYLTAPSAVDATTNDDVNFIWENTLVYDVISAPASYALVFESPTRDRTTTIEAGNRLSLYMTPTQFFNKINTLYNSEAEATSVKAYVVATIPGYGSVTSNVANITLQNTTFPEYVPKLNYITGFFTKSEFMINSTGNGMVPLYPSENMTYDYGEGELEYVGYMPGGNNGGFLILENPGDWFPSYRGDVWGQYDNIPYYENMNASTDIINFHVSAGYYTVTVNTKWHSCYISPYQGTVSEPYSTITIAGSFNDWSTTATPMQPLTTHGYNHDWEAYLTLTSAAEFKITDGSWDSEWGDGSGTPYGTATHQTNNFRLKAGNYRVVFNDITGRYIFIDLNAQDPYFDFDVIENYYYLVGTMNNWSRTNKDYMMTRNGDKFSINIPASENDIYFKVAPQSAYEYGHDFYKSLLCATGDDDTELFSGSFAVANNGGAFKIPRGSDATSYTITFDMKAKTYTIEPIAYDAYIYVVKALNNWGDGTWVEPLYSVNGDGVFTGYAYLDGAFVLRSHESDWDGIIWYNNNGQVSTSGVDFNVSEAGYYPITVDLKNKTLVLGDKITTIGLIGQQSGWSSDFAALTYNASTGAWEGTATIDAGTEFKFRANNGWDFNWGTISYQTFVPGDIELEFNGYNIKLTQGGTYLIKLWAWADTKAHCIFTKQ
ncbi:MAG: RagB/SusD family nutrient uptake outer membrane protein [Muribaculaceae bacterium]|nr:RagB/SusD family nutrient uptake outer membrane protein [Muribaculaceae bacterium]